MRIGKVIGTLTPAVMYPDLVGTPMLLVQPLTKTQQDEGDPIVAADVTRMAGPGELVYYESSREAALACDPWFVPVDDAIVGIVDDLRLYDLEGS